MHCSTRVRCTEKIRMTNTTDPSATVNENPPTLRLVWPQWQGAGVESVREFFSEVPLGEELANGFHARTLPLRPDQTQRRRILIDGGRGICCVRHPDFLRTSHAR